MKLMLKREGHALIPATEQDDDLFEKLRHNTWYKADLRKARNPDHHRKGFALIKLILDSQERYTNIEDLLTELKLQTGWYKEHVRSAPDSPLLDSMLAWSKVLPLPIGDNLRKYVEALRKRETIVYIPKSISFADMDQTDFETFYERVLDIAIQQYGLEEALEFLS